MVKVLAAEMVVGQFGKASPEWAKPAQRLISGQNGGKVTKVDCVVRRRNNWLVVFVELLIKIVGLASEKEKET